MSLHNFKLSLLLFGATFFDIGLLFMITNVHTDPKVRLPFNNIMDNKENIFIKIFFRLL